MESHSDPLDYPLPIVGVEALGRILIRLEAEGGWDEIIKRSDQDLIENNQNVREFLHRMWYRSPEEERILRTQAHLITHELLRTQAGLDAGASDEEYCLPYIYDPPELILQHFEEDRQASGLETTPYLQARLNSLVAANEEILAFMLQVPFANLPVGSTERTVVCLTATITHDVFLRAAVEQKNLGL